MLNTNLATRPFYNERAVRFWIAAVAVLLVAATAVNLLLWTQYSRSDRELAGRAEQDEARAGALRAQAARLRASVNVAEVKVLAAEAAQANDLIDRRVFSWTELFNRFEGTIPADVRITSVRKRVDRSAGTVISLTVLARDVNDVNQFIQRMEDSGAFVDVLAKDEILNDEGEIQAILEAGYRPDLAQPQVQELR